MKATKYVLLTLFSFFAYGVFSQTVIHCWDFNGTSPFNSPVNTDNRVTGSGSITHNITDVQDFNGNSSNACAGSAADAAFCPRGGTSEENNGNAFTLIFPTTGYSNIELSFWVRKTSTGFDNNTLAYSTNGGGSFTTFGTFDPNSTSGGVLSFDFSSIPAVNNNPDFQIRITLDGATGSAGNNRYDNIKLTGDVANTINIDLLSPLFYSVTCINSDSGSLDFSSSGFFNTGNTFVVELSDENGSFTNPLQIGVLSGPSAEGTNPSGSISYTIPPGVFSGNNYRIRIAATLPNVISDDNGDDITIDLTTNCTPPHITSLIINACWDSCSEGDNEFFFGNTGDYEMDFTADNTNVYYNIFSPPTSNYTESIVDMPGTTADFNANAGCPGLFIDAYNSTVPTNSSFLIAHENVCPIDEQDFSGLCADGPIYVVYVSSSNWITSGNFVNSTSCSGGIRYLSSDFTTTVNTNHVIDFYYECNQNSGNDGDYAVWDSEGGEPILHDNDNCAYSANVLPVELLAYDGFHNNNSNEIWWSTASELNNNYFNLYHSSDGKTFHLIHREEGNGTTGLVSSYSYNHHRFTPGINYYKLESVDYDGTVHLKGIISVVAEANSIFYHETSKRIVFLKKSDYAIYSPEGRLLDTVKNNDSHPFTGKGVYFIIDTKTGEKHKLFIGY